MRKAITVKEYMATAPITFTPDMNVLDAMATLVRYRISGGPVLDGWGNVVGMLTERDCLRITVTATYHGERGGRVGEYMSREVQSVDADMSIVDLAERFLSAPYRRYPVMKDNRLVGQISRRDVLRALLELNSWT